MVTIKIELTPEEFLVLKKHFIRNLKYGVGGTFGDGEIFGDNSEKEDKREFNIAKRIADKLNLI